MKQDAHLRLEASFSPNIKRYILYMVAFFLLISLLGIPLLLVWFLGLGQRISQRYFDNLHCVLTDRHLIFRKGIWLKVEKTIPLENIQDLTFISNPLLEYLDLKILKIETAGHSASSGADMKLVGIREAEKFKEKVLLQRHDLQSKDTITAEDSNTQLLMEIRDLLRELRDREK